jgi:hypothetical protein
VKKFPNILQALALTATTMVASFVLLQSAPAQAANLVNNGDFETGDFTGWTTNFSDTNTFVDVGDNTTKVAFLGQIGSIGFFSQTLNTMSGQDYTLSYDFLSDGELPNVFQVQVNGNTLFSQTDIPAQTFTSYSFNFVGTGSDTIQFGGQNDPRWLQLDNVVVDVVAVPEPFTIVGSLVGGTAALRMRKKLKSSHKP